MACSASPAEAPLSELGGEIGAVVEGQSVDEELSTIAASLPMVVRLNVRMHEMWQQRRADGFFERPEAEWLADTELFMAVLDSVWVRARYLIQFLLNLGGADVVKVDRYLPHWEFPPGILHDELDGYQRQASQIVAHVLMEPAAPRGLSQMMPVDLVHGFTTLLSAVPPGHVLHDALDEAWEAADTAAQRWIATINTGPGRRA